MPDQVLVAIIGGLTTLLVAIYTGTNAYFMLKMSRTTEKIHILVNSSMTAQLKISALALRRIAFITQEPEDEAMADEAEDLFRRQEESQSAINTKP